MKIIKSSKLALIILINFIFFAGAALGQETRATSRTELRAKAVEFVEANRYLDAFPILEKVAPLYPNDSEIWAHYGIAILARSTTLKTAAERKIEASKAIMLWQKLNS